MARQCERLQIVEKLSTNVAPFPTFGFVVSHALFLGMHLYTISNARKPSRGCKCQFDGRFLRPFPTIFVAGFASLPIDVFPSKFASSFRRHFQMHHCLVNQDFAQTLSFCALTSTSINFVTHFFEILIDILRCALFLFSILLDPRRIACKNFNNLVAKQFRIAQHDDLLAGNVVFRLF